jgi:hypothetical protein
LPPGCRLPSSTRRPTMLIAPRPSSSIRRRQFRRVRPWRRRKPRQSTSSFDAANRARQASGGRVERAASTAPERRRRGAVAREIRDPRAGALTMAAPARAAQASITLESSAAGRPRVGRKQSPARVARQTVAARRAGRVGLVGAMAAPSRRPMPRCSSPTAGVIARRLTAARRARGTARRRGRMTTRAVGRPQRRRRRPRSMARLCRFSLRSQPPTASC